MTPEHILFDRSLEDIRGLINEAEALDLASHTASNLVSRVRAICEGYAWMTHRIEIHAAYRARRITIRPNRVSDVWYPPAHLVKRIGRANDIGESVLYISNSESTALLEMRPLVGETFAILQMVPADAAVLPHVFDIALAETAGGGDPKVGATMFHQTPLGRAFLGHPENEAKLALIRSFLVRQFTRIVSHGMEHEYALALAVAKFHCAPGIDGIWYPSVAGRLIGTNAALTAEAADRLLRPFACWMIRVEKSLPEKQYLVKCIAKAEHIDEDGHIFW
jgi:hypothetical protein